MRLKSLHIKDYGILKDFDIDFQNNLSVLIGENGSGKSSIIECLAYIFGHLHKYFVIGDKTAEFIDGYTIEYEINDNNVFIESKYVLSKTNTFQPTIKINGEKLSISQIRDQYGDFKMFLPEKVILSYSGITEHLKALNKHFEDKFIQRIIGSNSYSLLPLNLPDINPFMYVKKEYVSFILLALFVLDSAEAQEIFKTIGIDINGCTTTITLKKPHWTTRKKEKENNSLWGMSGKIALDFLDGLALVGISKENRDEKTNDIKSIDFEFYGTLMIQDLFKSYFHLSSEQVVSFLDTLLCDDLLGSINITWGDGLSVDRLSEGEKQLILSVGLGLVLNKKNLLFLYDEPDVSLHPRWQQSFISNMEKGLDSDSMAVITTHSPSIVSDLQSPNLHLLRGGKVITKALKHYGKTVESILGDYFGLESTRNSEVSEKIDTLWDLIEKGNYEGDVFAKKMEELISIIGPEDAEILAMNREIMMRRHEKAK